MKRRDLLKGVAGAGLLAGSGLAFHPNSAWAASENWEQVEQAARKERVLSLSILGGRDTDAFLERLKKKFPWMELKYSGLVPSKFAPQVAAEQDNGVYNWDLYIGAANSINQALGPSGGVEELGPWLDALPANLVEPDKWAGGFRQFSDPKRHYGFIVYYRAGGGIFVNRRLASASRFSKIEDILKPEYQGKIVIYNPTLMNGGSMTLSVLRGLKGEDFVRKLIVDQKPVFAGNPRNVADWLSEGRYPVGLYMLPDDILQLKEQGLFKDIELIDGTRYAIAYALSVFKNAPHPNMTKLVMGWFLSREGQDAFAQSTTIGGTRRTDVSSNGPDVANAGQLSSYGFVTGVANGQEPMIEQVIEFAKSR